MQRTARPLRIDQAGAWYHPPQQRAQRRNGRDEWRTSRENFYRDDIDRRLFLDLLAELPERFGHEIHTFTLMDNRSHLLLRTAHPNLKREEWANRHGDWGRDGAM